MPLLINTNLKPGSAGRPVKDSYFEAMASVGLLRSIGK